MLPAVRAYAAYAAISAGISKRGGSCSPLPTSYWMVCASTKRAPDRGFGILGPGSTSLLPAVDDYLGYLEHNWPGSALVIDSEERGGEPQLLELLATAAPHSKHDSRAGPARPPCAAAKHVRRLLNRD